MEELVKNIQRGQRLQSVGNHLIFVAGDKIGPEEKEELKRHLKTQLTDIVSTPAAHAVLLSGPEGSGKSYLSRTVAQILAGDDFAAKDAGGSSSSFSQRISACLYILDFLGSTCHSTPSGDCFYRSSFGHLCRFYVDAAGKVTGADLRTYLLHVPRDFNLRVFHALLHTTRHTPADNPLRMRDNSHYRLPDEPSSSEEKETSWALFEQSLTVLGFSSTIRAALLSILSAIFLLGCSHRVDGSVMDDVLHLLGMAVAEGRDLFVRLYGEDADGNLGGFKHPFDFHSPATIARHLYRRLFQWVTSQTNYVLKDTTPPHVGTLLVVVPPGWEEGGEDGKEAEHEDFCEFRRLMVFCLWERLLHYSRRLVLGPPPCVFQRGLLSYSGTLLQLFSSPHGLLPSLHHFASEALLQSLDAQLRPSQPMALSASSLITEIAAGIKDGQRTLRADGPTIEWPRTTKASDASFVVPHSRYQFKNGSYHYQLKKLVAPINEGVPLCVAALLSSSSNPVIQQLFAPRKRAPSSPFHHVSHITGRERVRGEPSSLLALMESQMSHIIGQLQLSGPSLSLIFCLPPQGDAGGDIISMCEKLGIPAIVQHQQTDLPIPCRARHFHHMYAFLFDNEAINSLPPSMRLLTDTGPGDGSVDRLLELGYRRRLLPRDIDTALGVVVSDPRGHVVCVSAEKGDEPIPFMSWALRSHLGRLRSYLTEHEVPIHRVAEPLAQEHATYSSSLGIGTLEKRKDGHKHTLSLAGEGPPASSNLTSVGSSNEALGRGVRLHMTVRRGTTDSTIDMLISQSTLRGVSRSRLHVQEIPAPSEAPYMQLCLDVHPPSKIDRDNAPLLCPSSVEIALEFRRLINTHLADCHLNDMEILRGEQPQHLQWPSGEGLLSQQTFHDRIAQLRNKLVDNTSPPRLDRQEETIDCTRGAFEKEPAFSRRCTFSREERSEQDYRPTDKISSEELQRIRCHLSSLREAQRSLDDRTTNLEKDILRRGDMDDTTRQRTYNTPVSPYDEPIAHQSPAPTFSPSTVATDPSTTLVSVNLGKTRERTPGPGRHSSHDRQKSKDSRAREGQAGQARNVLVEVVRNCSWDSRRGE
ncbi:unnamed protein product [Vitrella brassicaformis CCMP3155]|uniref:Myosin motor domain-containing protein n=1 Tax=Vitrella brassicaformis (strain CCMP3155) TaxID=1169540 RepID=A0A0G4F4A9_VITBC|nr:unnamed protein product [Vitrella brassicaformis CCMP3155]|eukprot:CEM06707.1 unnamed protein product [Vitrella brassicaformis CCMP3155]